MSDHVIAASLRKIVRIQAKAGLAAAMRRALLDLQGATRREPGCREFSFFQALSDESVFLLVEDFVDAGALARHMNLPHTQAFFAQDLAAAITPFERGWMS